MALSMPCKPCRPESDLLNSPSREPGNAPESGVESVSGIFINAPLTQYPTFGTYCSHYSLESRKDFFRACQGLLAHHCRSRQRQVSAPGTQRMRTRAALADKNGLASETGTWERQTSTPRTN